MAASPPSVRPVQGRAFFFTGILHHYTRPQALQAVRDRMGYTHKTLTAFTAYVVAGIRPNPGHLIDADKLGVRILTEDQFRALVDEARIYERLLKRPRVPSDSGTGRSFDFDI